MRKRGVTSEQATPDTRAARVEAAVLRLLNFRLLRSLNSCSSRSLSVVVILQGLARDIKQRFNTTRAARQARLLEARQPSLSAGRRRTPGCCASQVQTPCTRISD